VFGLYRIFVLHYFLLSGAVSGHQQSIVALIEEVIGIWTINN